MRKLTQSAGRESQSLTDDTNSYSVDSFRRMSNPVALAVNGTKNALRGEVSRRLRALKDADVDHQCEYRGKHWYEFLTLTQPHWSYEVFSILKNFARAKPSVAI